MPVEQLIAQPIDPRLLVSPPQKTGLMQSALGALRRIFPGGPLEGEYGVQVSSPVLSPFQATPVPEPQPRPRPQQTTSALGGTGVPIYAGFVTDLGEYNGNLQGRDAFPTYEKMRRSDPDVRAALIAIKLALRCAKYQVIPGVTAASPLHGLATEIADFVEENMFGGLESMTSTGFYNSQSFESVLENALLSLDFGCAAHEILWHVDGDKVRIRKLAPRLPMTFFRFYPDKDGETLLGLEQYGYRGDCIDSKELIPSPDGWTTMGKVKVGDRVFDESGNPCTVTAKSPVYTDKPCYKITFSDGTSLVATDGHRWTVWDEITRQAYAHRMKATEYPTDWWNWSGQNVPGRLYTPDEDTLIQKLHADGLTTRQIAVKLGRTRSAIKQHLSHPKAGNKQRSSAVTLKTEELIGKLRKDRSYNFAIPLTQSVAYRKKKLPLDPYVLGYLLGDGTSSGNGDVACDYPDKKFLMDEFTRLGYRCNDRKNPGTFYVSKLSGLWRRIGLRNSKHIPTAYLMSSLDQRVALLQGLIDSDGCIGNVGEYQFSNTNPRLARGVAELARSLGLATKVRNRPPRRIPRTGNMSLPGFVVAINSTIPLARLPRKVSKARHTWNLEQHGRMIVKIEPVEMVPTQCITVDSPSRLYLVGDAFIPTHNSYINEVIPAEKIDYFTYDKEGANFFGRSILRASYMPWYIKGQLYRIDSISLERNGMGIPTIEMPENASDEDKTYARNFVTMVATHEQTGLTLPFGYKLSLVGTQGRLRDPHLSIQHMSEQILRSMLTQFLAFGTTQAGSRSLSQDMTIFFKLGLNAVARGITTTMATSSIRRLVEFNYGDSRKKIPFPRMIHSNIAALDPLELMDKLKSLSQWQNDVIQPDDELENFLRQELGLPSKTRNRVRYMPVQQRMMEQPGPGLTVEEIESGKEVPGESTNVVDPIHPIGGETEPHPPTPSKTNYNPGTEPNPRRSEGEPIVEPMNASGGLQASDEFIHALVLLTDATTKKNKTSDKIVVWDFDGTISVFPNPEERVFKPGQFGELSQTAKYLMEKLAKAGFTQVVVTARKDIDDVKKWIAGHTLPIKSVGNEKVPALIYVDDRGLHIDWSADFDERAAADFLRQMKQIQKQHGE
jgi:intein/homing endonuclease